LNNSFAERLEVRLVLYLTTFSVGKQLDAKIFELETFQAKWN
jgi:hypothetical protein